MTPCKLPGNHDFCRDCGSPICKDKSSPLYRHCSNTSKACKLMGPNGRNFCEFCGKPVNGSPVCKHCGKMATFPKRGYRN